MSSQADQPNGAEQTGTESHGNTTPSTTRSSSVGVYTPSYPTTDEPLAPPAPRLTGNAALPAEGKRRSTTPQERSASAGRQVALEAQQHRTKSPAYGVKNAGGRPTSGSRGGRGMGRRKAKRWVNDNLLGSAMLSHLTPEQLAEEMESLDIGEHRNSTALAELLEISPEAVSAFRSCKAGPTESMDETKKSNMTGKLKSFNGISHKSGPLARFQGAAYKFSRLDRRLRVELQNEISRAYVSLKYAEDPWESLWVKNMEDFIAHFDNEGSCDAVPSTLLGSLKEVPYAETDNDSGVVMRLIFDEPYYRLLSHGICQFHGLSTRSANTKTGKRVMYVTQSKHHDDSDNEQLSLTEYLVALKEAEEARKEAQERQLSRNKTAEDNDEYALPDNYQGSSKSDYVVV